MILWKKLSELFSLFRVETEVTGYISSFIDQDKLVHKITVKLLLGMGFFSLKALSVMTRLQICHTWITQSYLLKKEDQPFCHACHSPFTVKHVLIECSDFTHIRNKFYTTTDVHTLFREVDFSKIHRIPQGN